MRRESEAWRDHVRSNGAESCTPLGTPVACWSRQFSLSAGGLIVTLGVFEAACSTNRPIPEQLWHRSPTQQAQTQRRTTSNGARTKPREPLPRPEPRPLLVEGCAAGVSVSARPSDTLRELERLCVSSMRPLLDEPKLIHLTEGAHEEATFTLTDPTGCVRVAAAAEPSLTELELGIIDADGVSHTAPHSLAPFALLAVDGPSCFDRPGEYRVRVRSRRGSGRVALAVWTAH